MEITEGMARRYVSDALGGTPLDVVTPAEVVSGKLPEVQNAIRAALDSTDSALAWAR